MTEAEFFDAVLFHLEGIKFCAHATAFALAWIAGGNAWKVFIHGVKTKELW